MNKIYLYKNSIQKMIGNKDNISKRQKYINEINEKLSIMKKSQFRTTNFSLIEYFAENNYKPLLKEELITKLLKDYKLNPKKYVIKNDKATFSSERYFKSGIKLAISKNKSFMKGPGLGELSLNLYQTLQYLKSMYKHYTSNSSNISTPYKIFKKISKSKNKYYKIKNEEPTIKENMDISDDIDIEIEDQNSLESSKIKYQEKYVNNNNNNSSEFLYDQSNNQSNNNRYTKIKKDYVENSSNISFSNTNPDSNSCNIKDENNVDDQDIFFKKLYFDIFISSINNEKLENIVYSFNKYFLDVKAKKMNDKIEKEIEKINRTLHNLLNNKKIYEINCSGIKKWQNEIYTIYKIMKAQLKALETEISLQSYNYGVYVQLRDIIFKYETFYNNIVDTIKQKIYKLKDIEKELIENINYIRNCLYIINNNFGFNDYSFSRLSRQIDQIFKNINLPLNNNVDNEDEDSLGYVHNIIKSFKKHKLEIIDKVNEIDKYVGNITIF